MTDNTERIPQALRDRAAARTGGDAPPKRKPAASGARIIAAGVSVAAGIGLVGVMGAAAAGGPAAQPAAVPQPVQRIVVIEQAAVMPAVAQLPAPAPHWSHPAATRRPRLVTSRRRRTRGTPSGKMENIFIMYYSSHPLER